MAKTYLLCLANSKKYGERCIAGVQLMLDAQAHFHYVKQAGSPRWLRPVSDAEHGQVPANLVKDISVGDIISFDLIRHCPNEYQTENCLFYMGSIAKVRPATLSVQHLDQLVESQSDTLFGNTGRCLSEEEAATVGRSLVLVKPKEVQPYFTTPYNTKPRVKFRLGDAHYDLPMTDVNFFDKMQEGLESLKGTTSYIAVSLGVPFEGKYYKLAAGIIYYSEAKAID